MSLLTVEIQRKINLLNGYYFSRRTNIKIYKSLFIPTTCRKVAGDIKSSPTDAYLCINYLLTSSFARFIRRFLYQTYGVELLVPKMIRKQIFYFLLRISSRRECGKGFIGGEGTRRHGILWISQNLPATMSKKFIYHPPSRSTGYRKQQLLALPWPITYSSVVNNCMKTLSLCQINSSPRIFIFPATDNFSVTNII